MEVLCFMASKKIRHIVLLNEDLAKKFLKYKRDQGFSSNTQMYIKSVLNDMKRFYSKTSDETTKLQETMSSMYDYFGKKIDFLGERIEKITIIINQRGLTHKVFHAAYDILNLLIKREAEYSEILSKCKKYDSKTLDTAISFLFHDDEKCIGIKKKKIRGEKKYE